MLSLSKEILALQGPFQWGLEGWDGEAGCWQWGWKHQPWEEHQGNALILGAVCITSNLSGSGHTSPQRLQFIYTDEGFAGLCRAEEEDEGKVNSSGQHLHLHNTQLGSWVRGAISCPPGMLHSLSHIAACKLSGIWCCGHLSVCYCRCHFVLTEGGF